MNATTHPLKKVISKNLILLQNKKRLIQQEVIDLQKFLMDGINPGYLRVYSVTDALSRVHSLGMEHAKLTQEIKFLSEKKMNLESRQAAPILAAC